MPLSRQSSSSTRLSYSSSLSSVSASAAAGDPCTVTLAFLPLAGPRRAQNLRLTQDGRAVFSGSVRPRQRLSFVSQRRPPQPFALTAQLGELTAARVSVCCERRRPPGARLGGAASPLVVVGVSGGGGPCGRCLAASDRRLKRHQKQVEKLDRRLKRIFLAARVGVPAGAAAKAVKDGNASQESAADSAEREEDGLPPREDHSNTTETNDTQHTADTADANETERTPSSSDRSASQTDDSDSEDASESDSEVAEVEEAPSEAEESIKTESDSESESVREVLPA